VNRGSAANCKGVDTFLQAQTYQRAKEHQHEEGGPPIFSDRRREAMIGVHSRSR